MIKIPRVFARMVSLRKKPTNYEKLMNEMTPGKLAEITDNQCLVCVCRKQTHCKFSCREGIEKWLKQEAKDAAD